MKFQNFCEPLRIPMENGNGIGAGRGFSMVSWSQTIEKEERIHSGEIKASD
jgi:hypothetical protein